MSDSYQQVSPPAERQALSGFAASALTCLYQHRLLTTGQIGRLLLPDARSNYATRELRTLRTLGLVANVRDRGTREAAWFLTAAGAQVVEGSGEITSRAYRVSHQRASGPLQQHTLAVNETGLAFVEHARRLGHDCGPLDWTPEVSHRFRSGGGRYQDSHLICDALLYYVAEDPAARRRDHLRFFIEIDRATMSVARLAAKITIYARYYDYVPTPFGRPSVRSAAAAWCDRYPRYPRVLIVFDGKPAHALERRRRELATHLAALPYLQRSRDGFVVEIMTLAELREPESIGMILGRERR